MVSKTFRFVWAPLAAVLLAWIFTFSPVYTRLNYWVADVQLQHSAKQHFFRDSLIVDIDEASVRELQPFLGSWPYKRDTYGLLLDYLTEMGAKTVVFDILFPDVREGDDAFQNSISRNGNVLLAATGLNDGPDPLGDYQSQLAALAWKSPSLLPAYQWHSSTLPHSGLAGTHAGEARVGLISVVADEDGVLRRLPLLHNINGNYLPSLALAALFQNDMAHDVAYLPDRGLMRVNAWEWPVDSTGAVRLNFPGNGNALLNMTFSRLARAMLGFHGDELDKELFRGKTVFIGSTVFFSDRVNTPVGTITGIHALAMAYEILKNNLVIKPSTPLWNGLMLGIALLPSAWVCYRPKQSALMKGLVALGCALALYFLNVGLLARFQQQSMLLFPLLILALAYVLETILSLKHANQEQKTAIHVLAHDDALTGLPNRFSLRTFLEMVILVKQERDKKFAVLLVDLDHFKSISNTMGHDLGDQLLIEVANRLRSSAREEDFVARLGGDEFVVVVQTIDQEVIVTHLIDRIMEALSQPYLIGGKEIHTTACIGISKFPEDGGDVDALMKSAESAMKQAKSQGRNQYRFFTADMQVSEAEYFLYESGLRTALVRDEFFIHYQPQIDTMTGRVVAMEALVRWMHPDQGALQPGKFIHIAEETGLILPLGNWVLRNACQQLKSWHDAGLVNIQRIAVNLSTLQFHQPDLLAQIQNTLKEVGLEARFLELEITESVAMINPNKTIETLKALKSMGVALAIDDFGTGHSSLNYLKLFPFDCLKIDRSFVQDIESDTHDAAICTATIALANKLGLDVVAEGVETEGQFAILKDLNCGRIQGYFFSKPLSPEDAYSFALAGKHS